MLYWEWARRTEGLALAAQPESKLLDMPGVEGQFQQSERDDKDRQRDACGLDVVLAKRSFAARGKPEGFHERSPLRREAHDEEILPTIMHLERQVSLESAGPSPLPVTEVPRQRSIPRAKLSADLQRKIQDLEMDMRSVLSPESSQHSTNVEFCMQSACNVLQHLYLVGADASLSQCLDEALERRSMLDACPLHGANIWTPLRTSGSSLDMASQLVLAPEEEDPEKSMGDAIFEAGADVGSRRKSFRLQLSEGSEFTSSNNKCYLDPDRPLRMSWDFCAMMLILSLSVVIPLEVCFFWDDNAPWVLLAFADFLDFFFMLDIVLNFFTAFHEGHGISGQLVTDFKGIAKHYAKGWLVIDVVASFPWLRVMRLFRPEATAGVDTVGMLKVLQYSKVARLMKVLRVLKLGTLIQMVEEKMVAAQSMTVAFQLFKMTVVMVIISHNVACVWYAVAIFAKEGGPETWLQAQCLVDAEHFQQYTAAFYFALTTGTTVGYGDIHPVNAVEQAVTIIVLVVSVAYIGQFLARFSQMISSLRFLEAQTTTSKRSALLFMKKRAVPKDLQFKVLRYIEHVYETDAVTALDDKTKNILSDSLNNQLALAVTGSVLRKFPFFEDTEEAFLISICQVCSTRRAGVGDAVVTEGQAAYEMFWVVRGEAAVLHRGRQVGGLRDGDWFGELAIFWPGVVRKASVRCETYCEFLALHHVDFQMQLELFPGVHGHYENILADLRTGNPQRAARTLFSGFQRTMS